MRRTKHSTRGSHRRCRRHGHNHATPSQPSLAVQVLEPRLYFSASASLMLDANSSAAGSYPEQFVSLNGVLLFTASDERGKELWRTDGTSAGTTLVKDIAPGRGSSSPRDFVRVGNQVFFTAKDGAGRELWRSDGTTAGTYRVKDIVSPGSSNPSWLTEYQGVLYFSPGGSGLWRSDGTAAGTYQLADVTVYGAIVGFSGLLFFPGWGSDGLAQQRNGEELYYVSPTGDVGWFDINQYIEMPNHSRPDKLAVVGSSLYFAASEQHTMDDLQRHAYRISRAEFGALDCSQVGPGDYESLFTSWDSRKIGQVDGAAYFSDSYYDSQSQSYSSPLFKVTVNGVSRVGGGYTGWSGFTARGATAYFADAPDTSTDRLRVWRIGSSSSSASAVAEGPLPGNGDGTEMLDDPFEFSGSASYGAFASFASLGVMAGGAYDGNYFFAADDGSVGYELWKSDGTNAVLVKDINSQTQSSVPLPSSASQTSSFRSAPAPVSKGSTASLPMITAASMAAADSPAPLFDTGVDFAIPSTPISVALADFNGDGTPDVATSHAGQLSILLNTTPGGSATPTLAPRVSFAVNGIGEVATGDFNQDGKPDIAFVEPWTQRIGVMLNATATGASIPSFNTSTRFSANANGWAEHLAVADFNGDGKPDLAATCFDYYGKYYGDSGYVSVLLNSTSTGATTPALSAPTRIAETRSIRGVATGDFDADGKADLAWTSADAVHVSRNLTGSGASSPVFAPAVAASSTKAATLAVADFNGDGRPDIATGALVGSIGVLLSDTAGSTIAFRPQAVFSTGLSVTPPLTAADFSGDGLIDIAFTSTGSTKVGGVLLNGTGTGATVPSFASDAVAGLNASQPCLAAADLNADGHPDIVAGKILIGPPLYASVRVLLAAPVLPPPPIPDAPTNVTGETGDGHVILRWTAPTTAAGITDYLVQCSSDGGVSWQLVGEGVSSATTAAVPGLPNGRSYLFRVAARNASGDGGYSTPSPSLTPSAVPAPAAQNLVYAATDGTSGLEPWVTDGTVGGTRRLKDIAAGISSSSPHEFTRVGGTVYFLANGLSGTELWKSDGTTAGTVKLSLAFESETLSYVTGLRAAGGSLFFAAFSSTHGTELFRHDLATGRTLLVADIAPGSSWGFAEGSYPADLCTVGVVLYFTAADSQGMRSVWRTDALTGVTARVLAPQFQWPRELTAMGGAMYYVDDTTSPVLWRVEGPLFEAVSVATLNGMTPYEHLGLRGAADHLFWIGSDGASGRELWVSDGTAAKTHRVRDIVPGSADAFPSSSDATLVTAGSLAYFLAGPQGDAQRLWRSDGTEAGTFLLDGPSAAASFSGVSRLEASGDRAFFAATDTATGEEFWSTDGAVVGTTRIADVWAGPNGSRPSLLGVLGSKLLFMADDGIHGREPWSSELAPASDAPVIVPTGQTSTDTTIRTGAFQLVKQGGGTLILDKANTHSGGTVVEAGTIVVKNASALGSGELRVKAGATLVIDQAAGEALAQSLVIDDGGFVDLGTGRIRIASGMTASSLVAVILAAKGDGTWNGSTGIGSAAVAGAIASFTPRTLGWLDNGDGSFTVSFAAPGDTGLDGVVDITDVANFLGSAKMDSGQYATWDAGDFNLDGVVDQLDLADFLGAALFDIGPYVSSSADAVTAHVDQTSTSPTSPMTAPADLKSASMMQAFVALASGTPQGTTAKKAAFASLR